MHTLSPLPRPSNVDTRNVLHTPFIICFQNVCNLRLFLFSSPWPGLNDSACLSQKQITTKQTDFKYILRQNMMFIIIIIIMQLNGMCIHSVQHNSTCIIHRLIPRRCKNSNVYVTLIYIRNVYYLKVLDYKTNYLLMMNLTNKLGHQD